MNYSENDSFLRQSSPYMVTLGLHSPPFKEEVDENFFSFPLFSQRLYMLQSLTAGYDYLVLVIGEHGCGKTTLLNKFIAQSKPSWSLCRIRCYPTLDGETILKRIADKFGLQANDTKIGIVELNDHFATLREQGIIPVIIFDDAHELNNETLLSACRIGAEGDTRPYARLLFFCEPQIKAALAAIDPQLPKLAVLNKIFILPLNESQTADYLMHRLIRAGLNKNKSPLTQSCVSAIHQASSGRPGAINEVAHQLFLYNVENKNFSIFKPPPKGFFARQQNPVQITSQNSSDENDSVIYRPGWLLKQGPQRFTLQIISARKEKAVVKLVKKNEITQKAAYFHTFYKGNDWYILTFGLYDSISEAEEALKALPKALQKKAPWVRTMSSVHEAIKKGRRFVAMKK